jgi:hypothetical protein
MKQGMKQMDTPASALQLAQRQRSHVMIVLTDAKPDFEGRYLKWLQGDYDVAVRRLAGVLTVRHYERHQIDITNGEYAPLPYRYLGIYEISVDGAEAAQSLIDEISRLHARTDTARAPATWIYYPLGEKVGVLQAPAPISMLTIAFANGVPGQEAEFREWYVTRHIRHALNISALISGQCFERTLFQRPGAIPAKFQMIAIYEQQGTPESIAESFTSLPESTFAFPSMDVDRARFAESVYRALALSQPDRR